MPAQLSRIESLVYEKLKEWPQTKYQIECIIDHAKIFSDSYIKVVVCNINKKIWRKIIVWIMEDGFYKYCLEHHWLAYAALDELQMALKKASNKLAIIQKIHTVIGKSLLP